MSAYAESQVLADEESVLREEIRKIQARIGDIEQRRTAVADAEWNAAGEHVAKWHAFFPDGTGDAAIYRLTPPTRDGQEFVVVSAIDIPGGWGTRQAETMIFPSDGKGVTSWGELVMVPYKSHEDALADLGYEARW